MKYKCKYCEYESNNYYSVNGHGLKHTLITKIKQELKHAPKRTKIKCKKCNVLISKSNFSKHFKVCGIKKIKYNPICPFCFKEFKHNVKKHIDIIHKGKKRYSPCGWNKGLSKETDKRLEKQGKTFSSRSKSGKYKIYGHKKTLEQKQHLSNVLKGKTGGYRGGGKGIKGYYKNFHFDSQFEIEFAKYLDKLNINWVRNKERFHFEWKNKKTYYIPDFYFPDKNLYVETKGFWYSENQKNRTYFAVNFCKLNWILIEQRSNWKNKIKQLFGPIA